MTPLGEKNMAHKRNNFSGFAKGLFVGGLVGAVVAFLYVPKNRKGLRSDVPQDGVRSQGQHWPLSTTRVEKFIETEKLAKPSIGWLATFYVASAVAMISNLRMKKIQSNSYD